MIIRKSTKDIEAIARAGELLAQTHMELRPLVQAGATTADLDAAAEKCIRAGGGVPTFKGYRGFPGSICSSPNDMVVHGIPGDYELADGDVISIDCGVTLFGWVADSAHTYIVGGEGSKEDQHLIDTAYRSLDAAIEQCVAGHYLGDISHAVQSVVEKEGFAVVRELVGHGVGRNMHEDPQIPNYGIKGRPPQLEPGYVFAIEPMITAGSYEIKLAEDQWAIHTVDGSQAAHVEHTVAITEDGPRVLTALPD